MEDQPPPEEPAQEVSSSPLAETVDFLPQVPTSVEGPVDPAVADTQQQIFRLLSDPTSLKIAQSNPTTLHVLARYLAERDKDLSQYGVQLRKAGSGAEGSVCKATLVRCDPTGMIHKPVRIAIKIGSRTTHPRSPTAAPFRSVTPEDVKAVRPKVASYLSRYQVDVQGQDYVEYQVLEWVRGADAEDALRHIEQHNRLSAADQVTLKLLLIAGITHVLHKMHTQGLVHADVKPPNFIVSTDGVSLGIDFGLTSIDGVEQCSSGTPFYMPPECAAQRARVKCASDVYSLGCIFFRLFSKERRTFNDLAFAHLFDSHHQDITPFLVRMEALHCQEGPFVRADEDQRQRVLESFKRDVVSDSDTVPLKAVVAEHLGSLLPQMVAVNPDDRPPVHQVSEAINTCLSVIPPARRKLGKQQLAAISTAATKRDGDETYHEFWGTRGVLRLHRDGNVTLYQRSMDDGVPHAGSNDLRPVRTAWEREDSKQLGIEAGITQAERFGRYLDIVDTYRELYCPTEEYPESPVIRAAPVISQLPPTEVRDR